MIPQALFPRSCGMECVTPASGQRFPRLLENPIKFCASGILPGNRQSPSLRLKNLRPADLSNLLFKARC